MGDNLYRKSSMTGGYDMAASSTVYLATGLYPVSENLFTYELRSIQPDR